ncbi:MAG: metallophosphoesterase [Leptolyngbya sp.]|nr:metallophosphoesterase [Leptolyngbya sp.]
MRVIFPRPGTARPLSPHLQRFATGLGLGLILAICLACSQRLLLSTDLTATDAAAMAAVSPGGGPAMEMSASEVGQAVPGVLAAATEAPARVASAGPGGLYIPPRKDMRLVVISDLNSAYGSTDYDPEVDQALALMPFWQPDLVLCSGDMVAGQQRSLTAGQIQAMWQAFDDHVAAPLRQQGIPFGFTLGNHDASSARGDHNQFLFQQDRDLASAYWQAAAHDPGLTFIDRTDFPFFYTFEQNGIFFMAWDGSSSQIPADKLAWVEAALSSDAAQSAKARMVISHLPLYGVAQRRDQPGEVLANAPRLQALLERHGVHTLISGHHHAYYPAHRGNLQLLHAGLLGSGPRPLIDGTLAPWKALTVIDIDFADPDLTTYTTYDIQTLRRVSDTELPRFLVSHNGLILRRDVPYSDLTPTDKARCQARLNPVLCMADYPSLPLTIRPWRPTYAA